MQTKAPIPEGLLDKVTTTPLVQAWFEIVHLKQLYRQGWLRRGVAPIDCETVAEHSFGNAFLCLLLLEQHPELDAERVLRLALVHDLGEVYVGDLTPHDNVDKAEKARLESSAVDRILAKLPAGEKLIHDWHEYEAQQTPEARFVKEIDRLELALQASVYGLQGKVDPDEFLLAAEVGVTSPHLRDVILTLRGLAAGS